MSTLSRVLAVAFAVIVTTAVVAVLVLRSPTPETDAEPGGYRSRTLASLDTRTITVTRGPLCEGVPAEAVREALGREPVKARSYDNGDHTKLSPDVRDIAHEFGCEWRTPRTQARTWVFAPPVPRKQARQLADAAGRKGCRQIDDAPRFGRPSAGVVCRSKGTLRASYRGLFGDAWLTCELVSRTLDRGQLVKRTGRWCAGVLNQF